MRFPREFRSLRLAAKHFHCVIGDATDLRCVKLIWISLLLRANNDAKWHLVNTIPLTSRKLFEIIDSDLSDKTSRIKLTEDIIFHIKICDLLHKQIISEIIHFTSHFMGSSNSWCIPTKYCIQWIQFSQVWIEYYSMRTNMIRVLKIDQFSVQSKSGIAFS